MNKSLRNDTFSLQVVSKTKRIDERNFLIDFVILLLRLLNVQVVLQDVFKKFILGFSLLHPLISDWVLKINRDKQLKLLINQTLIHHYFKLKIGIYQ
jgi:hypothetical protein